MLCNITEHDTLAIGATRTDFAIDIAVGDRYDTVSTAYIHGIIAHPAINETKKESVTKNGKKTEQN